MNPYDFVPIDFSSEPERHCPKHHGSFDGISGTLTGTITAETPIFIKHGSSIESKRNKVLQYTDNSKNSTFSQCPIMLRQLVNENVQGGCPLSQALFGFSALYL